MIKVPFESSRDSPTKYQLCFRSICACDARFGLKVQREDSKSFSGWQFKGGDVGGSECKGAPSAGCLRGCDRCAGERRPRRATLAVQLVSGWHISSCRLIDFRFAARGAAAPRATARRREEAAARPGCCEQLRAAVPEEQALKRARTESAARGVPDHPRAVRRAVRRAGAHRASHNAARISQCRVPLPGAHRLSHPAHARAVAAALQVC